MMQICFFVWQAYYKCCSLIQLTVDFNGSLMCLNDGFDNSQANAVSLRFIRAGTISTE